VTWRPITSVPGYQVSAAGQVRRTRGRLVLSPRPHRGYFRVDLRLPSGRVVHRKVHLLVLEAFVGPRPSSRHHGAHFPDPDPTNNNVKNLRWALPTENELHKLVHGTRPRGGSRSATRPAIVVAAIQLAARAGQSFTAIGLQYGLHRSSVARIVRGQRRANTRLATQEPARAKRLERAFTAVLRREAPVFKALAAHDERRPARKSPRAG
jgi:hypothetical protein